MHIPYENIYPDGTLLRQQYSKNDHLPMPYISIYCVTTSSRFVGSMENYCIDTHQLISLKHTIAQLKSRFLFQSLSEL